MTAQRRTQQLLLALIGSIALLAAYLIGSHAGGADASPVSAPAASDPSVRGFSAPGTASVPGVPDQLSFSVSISRHSGDSVDAMNRAGAAARKLRKALIAAGVFPRDISTTDVNLEPTFEYSYGRSIPTGYDFSEDQRVLVHNLPQAGKVLSAAAVALHNGGQISGVSMQISDHARAVLAQQARAEAVKDSRTAAQAYADATGRKVGTVLYVEETTTAPEPVNFYGAADALNNLRASAPAVPISPGRQDVTVQVKVRWAIG